VRGIYIIANDKVKDNAIALLNSIRLRDRDLPIFLIPFNNQYQTVAEILREKHNVQLFPDLDLVEHWTQKVADIFDRDFLKLPNKMRKIIQWFGPLDEFLYIDTDIIVFQPISELLNYLSDYEFLCCDYHFSGRGLEDVFSPYVRKKGIFTEAQLNDVFNSGFWGARKNILTVEKMEVLLRECAAHREYFDFSCGTTDQPIMNYLILKSTTQRINLVKQFQEPGSWAGSTHFQERDGVLFDGDKPLRYLHWAGTPMVPGGHYRELWEYYRYWGETPPPKVSIPQQQPESWLGKITKKVKNKLSR